MKEQSTKNGNWGSWIMSSIINNGDLNAGRKRMKMRNKLKIVLLFFIITAISLGCIESQKPPVPNETKIATPEPTHEQKLPAYNETKFFLLQLR